MVAWKVVKLVNGTADKKAAKLAWMMAALLAVLMVGWKVVCLEVPMAE